MRPAERASNEDGCSNEMTNQRGVVKDVASCQVEASKEQASTAWCTPPGRTSFLEAPLAYGGGPTTQAKHVPQQLHGACGPIGQQRRLQMAQAQKRYKQKQREHYAAMVEEVHAKDQQLQALLLSNQLLSARERALTRAVEGGERMLSELGFPGDSQLQQAVARPCTPGRNAGLEEAGAALPTASSAAAASTPSSEPGSTPPPPGPSLPSVAAAPEASPPTASVACRHVRHGSSAPASPAAEAPAPAAPAGGSRASHGAGAGACAAGGSCPAAAPAVLGWKAPDDTGDLALEELLVRLRQLPPSRSNQMPSDFLEAVRGMFRPFAAVMLESQAMQPGPKAEAQLSKAIGMFVRLHGFVRRAFIACPMLRCQLRSVNLSTMAREEPPPGHWRSVVAQSKAREVMPPEAQAELRETYEMGKGHMARLRSQQAAILRQLDQRLREPLRGGEAGGSDASLIEALDERYVTTEQLLDDLLVCEQAEMTLSTTLLYNMYRSLPLKETAHAYAASYPFFLDTWSGLEALVEECEAAERAAAKGVRRSSESDRRLGATRTAPLAYSLAVFIARELLRVRLAREDVM